MAEDVYLGARMADAVGVMASLDSVAEVFANKRRLDELEDILEGKLDL